MKTIITLALFALYAATTFAQAPPEAIKRARQYVAGQNAPGIYPDFSYLSSGLIDASGKIIMQGATAEPSNGPANSPYTTNPIYLFNDVKVMPPPNGGNAAASNAITGIANVKLVPFATMTNGTASAKTKSLMDDTPAGEWSAIGGGTADPTPVNDAGIYRKGSNSLKIPFADAAVAGDGVKFTAFSAEDWESSESVGMWVYSSIPLNAGDVVLKTVDSTGDVSFNMPAVPVANKWTWVEFDISSLAGGTGDAVTNVKIALSTAGAAKGAFNLWIDGAWKWDATEELTLGVDLVDSPGAVRSFLAMTKANTGTHDMTALAEDTDFFVHSESGNDFLVIITDQSTRSGFALVCYK